MERSPEISTRLSIFSPRSSTWSMAECSTTLVSSMSRWILRILSASSGFWYLASVSPRYGKLSASSFDTPSHRPRNVSWNCCSTVLSIEKATRPLYSSSPMAVATRRPPAKLCAKSTRPCSVTCVRESGVTRFATVREKKTRNSRAALRWNMPTSETSVAWQHTTGSPVAPGSTLTIMMAYSFMVGGLGEAERRLRWKRERK
mmetsp:Transcript_17950/g.55770  ORF Transcript_17950/g.55770 Transcript_17950/m.55770 type:complete len:202 (-) Transcript_17950:54-659(-)